MTKRKIIESEMVGVIGVFVLEQDLTDGSKAHAVRLRSGLTDEETLATFEMTDINAAIRLFDVLKSGDVIDIY